MRQLFDALLTLAMALLVGCGPGWEGYEDHYPPPTPVQPGPWAGAQTVSLRLGEMLIEKPLAGLQTHDYKGVSAVSLSELVIATGLTPNPSDYRFDFTATDGYNLLAKRHAELELLPGWEEMKQGFLYADDGELVCGWLEHPWGGAESAYRIKFMNGGLIELLAP